MPNAARDVTGLSISKQWWTETKSERANPRSRTERWFVVGLVIGVKVWGGICEWVRIHKHGEPATLPMSNDAVTMSRMALCFVLGGARANMK